MPEGVSIAVTHNIAGSRMLHALSHIVKISYSEMLKSGMSEAFARSVVMSMAESGIREAGND